MKQHRYIFALCLVLACTTGQSPAAFSQTPPPAAQPQMKLEAVFDATTAWSQFEQLIQQSYAYFERPGIDGPAILKEFEARAKAAKTDQEFIEVLQTLAYNFADPHFVVGPRSATSYQVIPTASDLFGHIKDGKFFIADVRTQSAAALAGVPQGAQITSIDGLAPQDAIAKVLGRPFADATPLQILFGLNTALAGIRQATRRLEIMLDGKRRIFTLPDAR
jgi:carboxyl-terminal processing protease